MYKFTSPIFNGIVVSVFNTENNSYIPFDLMNIDYNKFLDDVRLEGESVVEGEFPQQVLDHLALRQINNQPIDETPQ